MSGPDTPAPELAATYHLWIELAATWARLGDADRRALYDLVRVREAMPRGVDAMVRVLKRGAAKHNGGELGIAPGVTADDCARHLEYHAFRAHAGSTNRDDETGELDSAHGAARGVMLAQLVEGGR